MLAEYDLSGQRADYALLNDSGSPATFVEAKKLGESLISHRMQMVNYANMSGVPYAGLTDGNNWELYVVFDQKPLDERRILDLSITNTPAHQCALKFLMLWRPNLATGQPVAAPVLSGTIPTTTMEELVINTPATEMLPSSPTNDEDWNRLADIQSSGNTIAGYGKNPIPSVILFPNEEEKHLGFWWEMLQEVAEYLVREGKLTSAACPIRSREGRRPIFVDSKSQLNKAGNISHLHQLSNGLYLSKSNTAPGFIRNARTLLEHFGKDPASVQLKFG